MAVQYSIRQGIITMDLVGTYEPREIVARFLDALADPECPNRAGLLVDVTRSESLATRPAADIRMVAEFLVPYSDRISGRCAVVVSTDAQFDKSQIGALRGQAVGIDAQVFTSIDEATAWLEGKSVAQD